MEKKINEFNLTQARDYQDGKPWRWGGEVRAGSDVYLHFYVESPAGTISEISMDIYSIDAERLRDNLTAAIKACRAAAGK